MRHLVSTILSSLGVKATATADRAFGLLFDFEADIIICDLRMDPQDGIEFTRMVRTHDDSPNCYVPIIMLTGHSEKSAVVQARETGVHEFLAKAVSAKKLYGKIRSLIKNPRAFIRTEDYFGPDRRRQDPKYDGPERRKKI